MVLAADRKVETIHRVDTVAGIAYGTTRMEHHLRGSWN
jgi:hypothetical protein